MDDVRFVQVSDEQTVVDWQHIHNEIIPTDPLSLDEVRERSGRHRLELAYVDARWVGRWAECGRELDACDAPPTTRARW